MSKKDKMAAAGAAAAKGGPGTQLACPLANVTPLVTIAAPKIVLVKKAYQKEAHRIQATLKTDCKFTGTGSLTSPQSANIKVFDRQTGGTQLNLPLALTGAELTSGRVVYVEAVNASASMNDTTLSLSIAGGDKSIVNSPGKDTFTRVELQLDLCKYKPTPGGADPAPLSDADKVATGRNIHLQDEKRLYAGRCLLIVRQAKPIAYTGNVVLIGVDNRIRTFAYAQEVPKTGEAAAQASPLTTANGTIPASGLKLWVEGAKVSDKVLDTGFTVEISDLPRREGDRVKITVVETRIDACQSRTGVGKTPKPIEDGKKMNPGRFVHLQDGGNHHGRARVVVERVKPKAFSGKLEVTSWDVKAKSAANPRLKLFAAELPGGGGAHANPHPINVPGGFPAKDDAELWAEGAKVSDKVLDTELRLKVADAEGWMDHAALTVCEFSALKADIPSTPAVTNRAGNSPVNRHEWKIADPAAASKDFDEDYGTNKPFVLIENSVTAAGQVNLTVKVKPAADVPVRWDVIRDRRPKPNGDHKNVIGLSGNKKAPTLGSNGEGLNNTLIADAVGSFHICPYVDCNGSEALDFMDEDGKRIDREPFIMMNLVLVRVQGVSNDSKGDKTQCRSLPAAGQTAANFGGFTTSGGSPWTAANSGWHADATVDVIGGGDDGLRGLDHVFGGWIQHIFLNGIRAVYNIPAPPPPPPPPAVAPPPPPAPPPRSHQYAFISNLPDNTHFGRYHYIGATESAVSAADTAMCIKTAPTLDASSILDVTPFVDSGTGGDSAVGSNGVQGGTTGAHGGGYPAPTARPLGQRWQREMWDAPGIGCRSGHISKGGTLASFRFHLGFRTDLCFWTSTDKKPDPTAAGVANRLYASVYTCTWTPDFAISFHPTTGAGTITTAKKIEVTKKKSAPNGRAVPVDGFRLETRAPVALGWYAVDART